MNFFVAILMQAIVTCKLLFVCKFLELVVEVVLGTNVYVSVRESLELKL